MEKREKVIAVLKKNGLEAYIPIFEKNNLMDKKLLSKMTEEQFERIGIENIGDRKKLVQIFASKIWLITLIIIASVLVMGFLLLHFTGLLGPFLGVLKWIGIICIVFFLYCLLSSLNFI